MAESGEGFRFFALSLMLRMHNFLRASSAMSDETTERVPLSPIVAWNLGAISRLNCVAFCLHYVSEPEQRAGDAELSRYYTLTVEQARSLAESLEAALKKLAPNGANFTQGAKQVIN